MFVHLEGQRQKLSKSCTLHSQGLSPQATLRWAEYLLLHNAHILESFKVGKHFSIALSANREGPLLRHTSSPVCDSTKTDCLAHCHWKSWQRLKIERNSNCVCLFAHAHVQVCECECPQKAETLYSLEVELWAVVSHLVKVLGTEQILYSNPSYPLSHLSRPSDFLTSKTNDHYPQRPAVRA